MSCQSVSFLVLNTVHSGKSHRRQGQRDRLYLFFARGSDKSPVEWLGSRDSGSEESCLGNGRCELHCRRLWDGHSALVEGQEVVIITVDAIWGGFPCNSGLTSFLKESVSFQNVLENHLKVLHGFEAVIVLLDPPLLRAETDYFILKSWRAWRFVILLSRLKCLLHVLCDRRAQYASPQCSF